MPFLPGGISSGGGCLGLGRYLPHFRPGRNVPRLAGRLGPGSVRLAAGQHLVRIRYETGGWHPGSGGTPYSFGPVALSRVDAREPVETVSQPRSLCGRRLDWIEALR
jgi:hypothetical protein